MTEQFLNVNGVRLCVETFGRADDPAILLIHGASASLLWWESELCERLAAQGRLVIRYDQRDTGRSTTYPVGAPAYDLVDLAGDALAILDRLGVERAHVVGCSMFGALVLLLGVDHSDRVASLTFVSTSTCEPGLPPIGGHGPDRPADLGDPAVQVEYVLGVLRAYDGVSPFFDETAARALVEADVARATDMAASLTNPYPDRDGPDRSAAASAISPPRPWWSTASSTRSSPSPTARPSRERSRAPSWSCWPGPRTTCRDSAGTTSWPPWSGIRPEPVR